MTQSNPKVVILGAGFGGLEATKTLRHAPVEITLIDRQNYHCFQPLLYQVATAALSPADIAWPIRHILRRQENATVFMAEVNGIDAQARVVKTRVGRCLLARTLLVGTGGSVARPICRVVRSLFALMCIPRCAARLHEAGTPRPALRARTQCGHGAGPHSSNGFAILGESR